MEDSTLKKWNVYRHHIETLEVPAIEKHYDITLSDDEMWMIEQMFDLKNRLEKILITENEEQYFVMFDILKQILKAPIPEMLTWNRKDDEEDA